VSGADLTCEQILRVHGRRAVLDHIDMEVEAGTSLVLLGSSGAGKTTLLRILAGLEAADGGRVRLGDRLLSDPAILVPPESRRIGMVFQALELWPQMTVAEHLAFGLPGRPRGGAARRHPAVRALAEQVGLPTEILRRRPATLSGGEQQRTAIARTLAAQPDVVLYDEPLANLDPDRRRALRALIRRLAREHGTTLVYVTHDPEEALEIGDEIAVMAAGRIVERGAPHDIYNRPRSLEGARALGPVTVLEGRSDGQRVRTALGEHAVTGVQATPGACRVVWRPEAVRIVGDGGLTVTVDDVVARGPDWAFTASVDGAVLHGRSSQPPEVATHVHVAADAPAAVLPSVAALEIPA